MATNGKYTLSPRQRAIEVARPWLLLSLYILFAWLHVWVVAGILALCTIMAGFVQMHDSIHNSLGVSKKTNDWLLTLSGLLLLKSGHAMKITHLRHHGQCLSENDPEGEPARWTFKKVLLNGPYHIFALRFVSLKISPGTRKIQLAETIATLLLLVIFTWLYFQFGFLAGLVYWGAAFVLSATMPIWATYVPHHLAPKNPLRVFSIRLVKSWTPIISSFAFHHVHHHHPKVPTALLPEVAKNEGEIEEHIH